MARIPILLATINARYTHAALGLRWLMANLGALREQAALREFHLGQSALQVAEALLADRPRLIGLGVYIWNVEITTAVVQAIKAVAPEVTIVLGGPEAAHEYEATAIFRHADYLIRGEGEVAFAELARAILDGRPPEGKVIDAEPPDLGALVLPYDLYTDADLAHRRIYVEASRGCPFRCDFCLSALDPSVREFPLPPLLDALERLIERGARQLKFVDRTFNLHPARVRAILEFFLERWREGLSLHFEIVPDRLGEDALGLLARFPAGALQLEVGVQTFNPDVQEAISRRQDLEKTVATLGFLRKKTRAWLHADLIAGLPGESWESFAAGFDRLLALGPQAIQVGILKRLRGAPIARHAEPHAMVFAEHPPYEILQTDLIDFARMQRLRRFARYFDLVYNSGNFPRTLGLLWATRPSAFEAFMALSDEVWARTGRTAELALARLAEILYEFLMKEQAAAPPAIAEALEQDFRKPGRREKLAFLK